MRDGHGLDGVISGTRPRRRVATAARNVPRMRTMTRNGVSLSVRKKGRGNVDQKGDERVP